MLDEFLIVAPSFQLRKSQLYNFISFCNVVGVPIALGKTCGPGTVLSFAGIELDSNLCEVRLPWEKIEKFLAATSLLSKRKVVILRDLPSLVRLLNFACSVVTPGRPFLRRLIDLTTGVRSPYQQIRLTKGIKADLEPWKTFLSSLNGKSFFLSDQWCNSDDLKLFTDSAGSLGFGAIFWL